MRRARNTEGFTFIEMIVVATIVAVLAAISIPIYIGYVNNQKYSTVCNLAETAAAAGNAYYRRTNTNLNDGAITSDVSPLFLHFSNAYNVSVSGNLITVNFGSFTNTVSYK